MISDNHSASISRETVGQYRLTGELNFDSVPELLAESMPLFRQDHDSDWNVDFTGVNRANSAALGLMLEWMYIARQRKCRICFQHVPDELQAIAHVTDLQRLLPIQE